MKTYYDDYVHHCMRFFARNPQPTFQSEVDRLNWTACRDALNALTPQQQEILLGVYRERDAIPDNIFQVSRRHTVSQDSVWALVKQNARTVAKRRNLI